MIELLDLGKPLSLYIHVPFCHSKCGYCAFYSIANDEINKDIVDSYFNIIIKKLEALNDEYKRPYYSIFIGGGNPGFLGYERLFQILKLAQKNGNAEEVTIEINPEYINEKIRILFPYLNRISVGIQSFDDMKLKVLERNTNRSANEKAMSVLSKLKKEHDFAINADLICCVPSETVKTTINDIDILTSYPIDHISLYALSFEEGTRLIEKEKPLDEGLQLSILENAWNLLKEKGFEHYEVSNFAKNGKYCLHNLVYWNLGQYIGIGPSAESSLGYKQVYSLREKETLSEYIKDQSFYIEKLNSLELEEEYLITTLRTCNGIDKKIYKNRFNKDFDAAYSSVIKDLDKEYYENDKEMFSVTEKGFLMLDSIIFSLFCSIDVC